MLRKDITYESPFDPGQKVTETHYFHISKTDLVEMEIEEHGETYTAKTDAPESGVKAGEELTGMRAKLQRIQDSQDGKAILIEMKDLIRRAYGKKDGERFIKTEELQKDFLSTEAFSQLLWDLCTNPDAMAEFVNGVFPTNLEQIAQDVQEQAAKIQAGREAQAAAKPAGAGHPSDAAATPVEAAAPPEEVTAETNGDAGVSARQREIANATAAEPVTLTEAEITALDSDDLKSGLATGRYKIG